MEEKNGENIGNSSYLMRKIPVMQQYSEFDIQLQDIERKEETKVLELSNIIDKWEEDVLFSENGFYSLKGIDTENKINEFEKELESFINFQINKVVFKNIKYKEAANKIKNEKIESIKNKMRLYEHQQLNIWQLEVYDSAIKSSIRRAVLYKSDMNIVNSSLKNGLSVLELIADKENWNKETYKVKSKEYKSEFYTELIYAFLKDRDINAYKFFMNYKKFLKDEDINKLESCIENLRINVTAYNFAKEIFSYELSEIEQEKKIAEIKDKELEKNVRKLLISFSKTKKENSEKNEDLKNTENWKEIIDVAAKDIDIAHLYIDFTGSTESINCKNLYIKEIKKNGFIKTDKSRFIEILSIFFENFEKFKNKSFDNYRCYLKEEDYALLDGLKKLNSREYDRIKQDYIYAYFQIDEKFLKEDEDKYLFIQLLFDSQQEYKAVNKKTADLETRNKIIETVIKRFKQQNKGENNDGIINNSRK